MCIRDRSRLPCFDLELIFPLIEVLLQPFPARVKGPIFPTGVTKLDAFSYILERTVADRLERLLREDKSRAASNICLDVIRNSIEVIMFVTKRGNNHEAFVRHPPKIEIGDVLMEL